MTDINETLRTGLEHHRAGRLAQAEQMYRRILQAHPRHAGAIHLIGLIAFQVGKPEIAERCMLEAIKIDAFRAAYPADLGEIQRALGKIPEAIEAYRKAIALDPRVADAHNNLGALLQTIGNQTEAIACFRQALQLDPQLADAHGNLGASLEGLGALDEARAAFEKAVQLSPGHAEGYLRLGQCLWMQGESLNAIACFQKATRLQPELAEAHYQCALVRLAQGDFANGWRDFEWRLQCPRFVDHAYSQPRWNGAPLRGARVLVHAEQGLEDTLQFIRYVPRVISEREGEVVLEVPPRLIPLLEQSGFSNLIPTGEAASNCSAQAPLLSLPGIFGTTLTNIPAQVPYFSVKDEYVAEWRTKLAALSGLRVGIAWQGDPNHVMDQFRSIPLAEFQPLANVPRVRLISLQKTHGLDQLAKLGDRFSVATLPGEWDETRGAFVDTAAVIKNLDLVVTADTAVAHLAGALGVPVWVALSAHGDWRWFLDRRDSPWYPTMRLYRQESRGNWSEVFSRMADDLASVTAVKPASTR